MNEQTRQRVVGSYQAQTVRVQYQGVGDVVRVGTVVEHRAGEFRVEFDDERGGSIWTILGHGWALATAGAIGAAS